MQRFACVRNFVSSPASGILSWLLLFVLELFFSSLFPKLCWYTPCWRLRRAAVVVLFIVFYDCFNCWLDAAYLHRLLFSFIFAPQLFRLAKSLGISLYIIIIFQHGFLAMAEKNQTSTCILLIGISEYNTSK